MTGLPGLLKRVPNLILIVYKKRPAFYGQASEEGVTTNIILQGMVVSYANQRE